jgi:hypothetical protein
MSADFDDYWQAVKDVTENVIAELLTPVELCGPCFKGAHSTGTAIGRKPLLNVAHHRR